ncbi:hypothetical protein OHC33_007927 [Knufia fluminis]|uniref:EDC4-like protein pdc1 beta-propeller domain-containing protein n=1 Tax=Knufia fluminis TaxID=191047 RepID=A0AAN8EB73_9EURO|nr:hypothetical protein OHC33_007927 [Knufia fluminis]
MSNPELQALLANLRPRSQASSQNMPVNHNTNMSRDPSTSFRSNSAIPSTPPPPFSPTPSTSNAAPPNVTAQNLLNLLNFNRSATQNQTAEPVPQSSFSGQQATMARPAQENTFTAADLLARAASSQPRSPAPAPSRAGEGRNAIQQENMAPEVAARESLPTSKMQHEALTPAGEGQSSIFTYKNPFEALRASRPQTPRSTQQPGDKVGQQQIPQEEEPVQSIEEPSLQQGFNQAMPERVKLMPKSRTSRQSTPAQMQVSGTGGVPEVAVATPTPLEEPATVKEDITETAQPKALESELRDTGGGSPPTNGSTERVVPVLSFPVKAFVSITLQLKDPASVGVRQDGVMEISRLKKDFDQMDRSLAAASSKYITYASVKNGGMRVIRQADGKDRHIFKHTHDRIFNVSVCTTSMTAPPSPHQAVLGTGVSGSVYYATISKPDQDFFDANDLEAESLVFPAYPQADENTAGGVLKTRAKRSSKHPEFFAIGRGRAIHIVWPSMVMQSRYGVIESSRQVNIEKLFQERSLQILTGKAGKDFNFSEDDTMIVSLDKTGRLRFWDIRKLIEEENARAVQITPYVIDTPLLSLATASPAERSWPTSVLFVDKARPYIKGGALRYVLVGLRQNHTLQLWDIALGKAVQEINFPHENETDGICSVTYHPATGIIAVGHPTRNSIFFIHLSAPRYILSSSLTQASYVQRVAAKDPDIPKPESTACMSGIREISFEGRGQLRSVELLPYHKQSDSAQADNDDTLFELYVAHSIGVTCLMINKDDLGWDAEHKVIQTINAEQDGSVLLKDLKLGSIIEENTRSKSPVAAHEAPSTGKSKKKKDKKSKEQSNEPVVNGTAEAQAEVPRAVEPPNAPEPISTVTVAAEQPGAKESKKSKKKKDLAAESAALQKPEPVRKKSDLALPSVGDTSVVPPPVAYSPSKQTDQLSMSISGDWLDKELKKIEKGVASEFKKELESLYQDIKTDRASQDQASASRQEAVLRVVSTTLNTNVETSLSDILRAQMQEVVVPSVVQTVSTNMSQQITQAVSKTVQKELGSELPIQLNRTLQSPQMLTRIADDVATIVAGSVQHAISQAITTDVASSLKSIAAAEAREAIAPVEARMADQLIQMQRQHYAFNDKIEQLNGALQSVAQTLQSMSQAQVAFQEQVLQDRRAQAQEFSRPASAQQAPSATYVTSPDPNVHPSPAMPQQRQKTQAELEIEEVADLMEQRQYEEGSIRWLQSSQPEMLFDELFSRYTPDYLATDVSPLVAFSIGVTVANSLSTNTARRLEWIAAAFDTVDFQDREIVELAQHAPQLINGLIQKLDNLYMQTSQSNPRDVVISMIPPLVQKARTLKANFQSVSQGRGGVGGGQRGMMA